jgi:hypothetical protein
MKGFETKMFIGHLAVGLGAKKYAPELNLGILFIACQLLDLIWPVLVLVGIEKVSVDPLATAVTPFNFEYYPYSHSLVMTLVYSISVGLSTGYVFKSTRIGLVLGFVTASHWILDFVTHRPDMPISFEGLKVGLGMWNSVGLTVVVEFLIFAVGSLLFVKTANLSTRKRKMWFWGLIIFLLLIYSGNILGPKPEINTPPAMIAGPALAMWLIVLWGFLVDRKVNKTT